MKKRLISLMTILAMLAAFVVPVSAGYTENDEYYLSNWTVQKAGTNDGRIKPQTYVKHSGNYSMMFWYTSNQAQNTYMRVINTLKQNVVANQEYTLEFWADEAFLNNFASANMQLMIGWGNATAFTSTRVKNSGVTENNMTKYTLSHTPTETGNQLVFLFNFNCNQFKIDDVKFYGSDGVDLVQNGSFEDIVLKTSLEDVRDSEYPMDSYATQYLDGAVAGTDDLFAGISDTVYCEGNGSLGVRKMGTGNFLFRVGQMGTGWHTLSFKAKGIYSESKIAVSGQYYLNGAAASDGNALAKTTLEDGWTEYTMKIWSNASNLWLYFFGNAATMMYIDDVKLTTVNVVDGVYIDTGIDLFSTVGKFNYKVAVKKVDNLVFDGTNVTWEISDDFVWDGIDIFVNDTLTEECDYDATSCALSGIKNGDVITVKTYSMDDNGNKVYNDGVSVTVDIAEIEIADSKFDVIDNEGNVTAEGILAIQQGNIKVTKAITNNSAGADYSAILIVALYNGNEFKDVKYSAVTPIPENGEATELYTTITVPGDGYSIKAMLWDSFAGMTPIDNTPDEL